jgi:uncharacterized membrane protein
MSDAKRYAPPAFALFGAALGLVFAALSSVDYIKHLDRQIHDVHCSYVPGLAPESGAENACRVAMYSPYSALFRDRYWGGVPIALFAVGAFSFFAAFALYLLLAGARAPLRARSFLALAGTTPLLISFVMASISALRLGHFCKTCVGIYIASGLLSTGGLACLAFAPNPHDAADRAAFDPDPYGLRASSPTVKSRSARAAAAAGPRELLDLPWIFVVLWLAGLAAFTVTPALLYVSALPSYASVITGCGKLDKPAETTGALLHITPAGARQPATLFVDPLCPTCKALHQRLTTEGILAKLDLTLVLFPLDSECNWMLDRPVHPGACVVSRAIMCSDRRAMEVLDWSYDNQEALLAAAKAGAGLSNVRAMIKNKWPALDACIDAKDTAQRQSRMLRYIVNNQLPVSTPQMFLGETRLCDEDTDMGLSYTIRRLAPSLVSK